MVGNWKFAFIRRVWGVEWTAGTGGDNDGVIWVGIGLLVMIDKGWRVIDNFLFFPDV